MAPEEIIVASEDVLGGTPVFAGTRVPVRTLFAYLKAGDTVDAFLLAFPTVSRDQEVKVLERDGELLLAPQARTA